MLIKNKIFLWKRKTTAFCQKTRKNQFKTWHFGNIVAITAFDENHSFRDFRVSVIILTDNSPNEALLGGAGSAS